MLRRNFIRVVPGAAVGLAIANSKFASAAVAAASTPQVLNRRIVQGSMSALTNMITKLKTTGASEADVRETSAAVYSLFGEMGDKLLNDAWNKRIQANRSTILSYKPSTADLQALTERVQKVVPSLEFGDFERLYDAVTPEMRTSLLNTKVETIEQNVISGFSEIETSGNLTYEREGLHPMGWSKCNTYAAIGALLAIISVLAPEVDLVIIVGVVTISLSDAIAIIAAGYGLAALTC